MSQLLCSFRDELITLSHPGQRPSAQIYHATPGHVLRCTPIVVNRRLHTNIRGEAVTAPFLKAIHEEVQKDGSPWWPTKGMTDHAGAFKEVLIAEFPAVHSSNCFAQLNRAQMTQSIVGIMNDLAMDNTYYTLCGQHVHSLPQALSGNCARASLSGHSSLVALCSLVFSHECHYGLRHRCHHHPVACVAVRVSKPGRD